MLLDKALLGAASLSEAADPVDLHRRLARAVKEIGCDHFLLGLQVKLAAGPVLQHVESGYPEAWQRRYAEQGFIRLDPTIGYCQTNTAPIVWSPTMYSEQSFPLLEESHQHGLGYGISVGVHQGANVKSMFSMARDQPFTDPRETALILAAGNVVASMCHIAMQRFVVPSLLRDLTPDLTDKEMACLRYTAEGKGSAVIGDLLNMTEDGVNYHMTRLMRKLGVATRMQAVAMGMQLGLLTM